MKRVHVKSQSTVSKIGDVSCLPLMYLLQYNIRETPQRTHRWNNVRMESVAISHFTSEYTVTAGGDTDATARWFGPLPIFHMPILGGWSDFIVIEPVEKQDVWHIGWLPFDTIGISQIPLSDKVRVLVGPRQAQFFGIDGQGEQISIKIIGKGKIGEAGIYSKVPLL